jgi:hypothetical protein
MDYRLSGMLVPRSVATTQFVTTFIVAEGQPNRIDQPAPACAAARVLTTENCARFGWQEDRGGPPLSSNRCSIASRRPGVAANLNSCRAVRH